MSLPPPFLAVQAARPITPDQERRIALTVSSRDCASLPRVPGAGTVDCSVTPAVQTMHNGVKVAEHCYCGPWMTSIIARLQGHHEPQEELAFHQVLERLGKAASMVELGAYWSYYSLWFHRQYPQASLLMVEPDPNFLEIGRYNLSLNGASGEFIQAAVGARPGPAAPFTCESDGVSRPVPFVSVDSLLESRGRVDVLLADIQGAELDMLKGMVRSLEAGKIRVLFLSTHDQSISDDYLTHEKCLQWLREKGAIILAEHTVEESWSGDGLIVASFDPSVRPEIRFSFCRARDSVFGLPNHRLAAQEQRLAAGPAGAALPALSAADAIPPALTSADEPVFTSFAQNAEDVLLWRALRGISDGFYIDVGAFHPVEHSVTEAFYRRGWRGLNIEPVPSNHERFVEARPRDINLQTAVAGSTGSRVFYEVEGTGLSSLETARMDGYRQEGLEVREHQLRTMTLADICREHVRGEIHFLKIDVEKSEREVLLSADFQVFRPWIVVVESIEPLSDEPSHGEWEPLLLEAGYEFLLFDGINRYYASREKAADVRPHFSRPVNVMDQFRTWQSVLEERRLHQALAETASTKRGLSARKDKLKKATARHKAAKARIRKLEHRLRHHAANPLRALKLWWNRARGKKVL